MNDTDYLHLMVAVFLILMELLMAVAMDYQLHHPGVVIGTV